MSNLCIISFPRSDYVPITLEIHQNLSEHLTIQNSPVLFGCRTGICGTCLVEVIGEISPLPLCTSAPLLLCSCTKSARCTGFMRAIAFGGFFEPQ
ncbi:MAG: 2Fe-2S iron-sulfur cluster binding domain-containing protein [Mojavia pulchra JT2-VF2]|uniref:2Fe-2S iron-sulfur cluster binding domain-containing protein n=1 Tax=Mojavia pulchra JT2-VF2 TaxID=287848 RepID=A0A951UHQ5_9NOST|nr:2Fe-2S iron-sulfur cluster binding domain-containing protein [Mojavia pulchra JT2-VF2]